MGVRLEHLPSMCEALGSISGTETKQRGPLTPSVPGLTRLWGSVTLILTLPLATLGLSASASLWMVPLWQTLLVMPPELGHPPFFGNCPQHCCGTAFSELPTDLGGTDVHNVRPTRCPLPGCILEYGDTWTSKGHGDPPHRQLMMAPGECRFWLSLFTPGYHSGYHPCF